MKNKLYKFLVVSALMMLNLTAFGQEMKISGNVQDSTGTKPATNAMVMAVRIKDSLLLGFTRTDQAGKFELSGFPVDTFSLIIDHPSFDDKTYYMFGHKDNAEINIPSIRLAGKSQEIDEVVIYANREPIFYRGDTLVYVADSFATHEGAVVEDLLKKLPGIKIDKDGKITSQGQEISQVLVDGDEFFGTDPTIATKNLGADGIEQVQVYEKENEEGIGGDDEKIQVLDLKLKDDAKKGYFGRVSGASDFALSSALEGNPYKFGNSFYEGELLLNRFKGSQKISVFALTSNTPRSNFGWGDLNKFGLENEEAAGSRWNPNARQTSNGIPQTLKAGVYFSDKFGKKKQHRIGVNYSYYNNVLDANSAKRSEYQLSDTTYFTDDSTRNYSANQSHKFNLDFESKLDSLTTLQIKPSFSYDIGETDNSDISKFFNSENLQTLGTDIRNKNKSEGFSMSGFAKVKRKFKKKKRELEVRYDMDMNDNETDGNLSSQARILPTLFADSGSVTNQSKFNNNSTTNHYGSAIYTEPIAKRWKVEFEYLYQYGIGKQDKQTRDYDSTTSAYSAFNSGLSNIFDNTKQQHRGGVRLIWEPKKHYVMAGVRVRNIDILNSNKITNIDVHQNITNVLPSFTYRFRPSMSKQFRLEYKTSSAQPSINDLQPVPDNTNPNRIQLGNSNLKPNYIHSLNLMFNTWQAMTGKYVWAGANFNYTQNAFADSVQYNSLGQTVTRRVNVPGNAFAVVYAGAGFPLLSRKIEISPGLNGSYFQNTNYIAGTKNVTDNFAITPGLEIEFNLLNDSLEIYLEGSYSYNNAVSTVGTARPFSIGKYGIGFEWQLPLGFKIGADGTYTKNDQPGDGFYDTEFFILNAEISKKFLKTNNLELALVGNDILNQNINARREINGNVITDHRTTIISRYFLLKLTWRFNNRKTTEKDFDGWH